MSISYNNYSASPAVNCSTAGIRPWLVYENFTFKPSLRCTYSPPQLLHSSLHEEVRVDMEQTAGIMKFTTTEMMERKNLFGKENTEMKKSTLKTKKIRKKKPG